MLPSGIYFETFAQERRHLRTAPQRAWAVALLAFLAAVPWLVGDAVLGIATVAAIALVAVLGLQVTIGMAGLLNLGQSAFVGVGAFAAASLAAQGFGLWVTLPAAALAAGSVSILFGLPAIRIKGFYLALTTIAAQIMFPIVVIRLPDAWFGGAAGMAVDPPRLFGVVLDSPRSMYWLAIAVAIVAWIATMNLGRSRTGRAFRAIRDNDIASSVMGVDLPRYKVVAFFAGALFAGLSGALYAYYVRYVTTDQFTLWLSVWYVGMLIVGGLHSPLGAVLGVIAITVLQETMHWAGALAVANLPGVSGGSLYALGNVVLGSLIVLMLLFEPLGIAHRWALLKASYRIWPYPRS